METQIRQALARGYCTPENEHKELDAVLIEAMKEEIIKSFSPDPPLVLRLYEAAKSLSDSCGDNYGYEAAYDEEYETYFSEKAKTALDKVLAECEEKCVPNSDTHINKNNTAIAEKGGS